VTTIKIDPIATGERPVNDSEPAHPNPQLQRGRWTSLDGPWRFAYDDERKFLHPSEIARWDTTIEVPFPPESEASGINDRGFHSCCWYERDFEVFPDGERRTIEFAGQSLPEVRYAKKL